MHKRVQLTKARSFLTLEMSSSMAQLRVPKKSARQTGHTSRRILHRPQTWCPSLHWKICPVGISQHTGHCSKSSKSGRDSICRITSKKYHHHHSLKSINSYLQCGNSLLYVRQFISSHEYHRKLTMRQSLHLHLFQITDISVRLPTTLQHILLFLTAFTTNGLQWKPLIG